MFNNVNIGDIPTRPIHTRNGESSSIASQKVRGTLNNRPDRELGFSANRMLGRGQR